MTKYSNTSKKADQYLSGLAEHWKERRAIGRSNTKKPLPSRLGSVVVNDCWRPSAPQSKDDLADLHRDKMRGKGYGFIRRGKMRGQSA